MKINEITYVNAIRWLAYGALAVPLVFSVYFYPSHIALQTFLFRTIVEAMGVAYVALLLKNNSFAPKSSAVLWAFAAFLFVSFFSAFIGEGIYRSFFSDFERHWGVATLAHFFLFFVVLASVFRGAVEWKRLRAVSVGVSILVAAYGLYQFFSADIGRAYSTVGNPAFFAAYLLLNAVIAISLISERFSVFWAGVAAVNSVAALLTATRGAMFAFFAGVAVFGLGYFLFIHTKVEHPNRRRSYLRMYVLVAVALATLLGAGYLARESVIMRAYGLNRLFSVSLSEVTAKTRLYAWQAGWNGFMEQPFFGFGPEHFNIVFNKYFNSDYYTYEKSETEFDRAHNIFFEQFATGGIAGLAAYLALFAAMLFTAARLAKNGRMSAHAATAIFAFAVVYAAQGLLAIDVLTSFLPFSLVLGYLASLEQDETTRRNERDSNSARSFVDIITIVFVCAVGVYCAWTVNIKPALANRAFSDAHAAGERLSLGDPKEVIGAAVRHYQKAISYDTYGRETVRADLARFTIDAYGAWGRNAEGFQNALLPFAFREAEENIKENPRNYLYYYHLARLYAIRALISGYKDAALERIFAEANSLAPFRLELPFAEAHIALVRNNFDDAAARALAGIARNKKFADFYRIAFLSFSMKGDEENAFQSLDEGAENGLLLIEKEVGWLASRYEREGMTEKADALRKRFPLLLK